MQTSSFPVLRTERLLLRQMLQSDAGVIATLRSDDVVNRYIERPPSCSVDEAFSFIEKVSGFTARGESFYWAISLQHDPRLIGTCCVFHFADFGTTAELGYELLPLFHGKGLMSEAVAAVVAHVFAHTELETLKAVCHEENKASNRLLLKQGFTTRDERDPTYPAFRIYEIRKPAL